MEVRALRDDEREWLVAQLQAAWGSTMIVHGSREHDAAALPALVCCDGVERLAVATYAVEGGALEVVTLQSIGERAGAGSALIGALATTARELGCERLWLVTTNDNTNALRFYQRRGLRIVAAHPGAADRARERKPSIPLVGEHGIEIHDEIELELRLR